MNRKLKVLVYTIVIMLATIFLLVGLAFVRDGTWQGLLFGLATELIGAILIFVIVDNQLSQDHSDDNKQQQNIIDELTIIKNKVSHLSNPLKGKDAIRNYFFLPELLATATSVDILGYTLNTHIGQYHRELVKASENGVSIRMLMIDPDSVAGQMSIQHRARELDHFISITLNTFKKMQSKISPAARGMLLLRKTSWMFSCSMTLVRYEDKPDQAFVIVNPLSHSYDGGQRIVLVLNSGDHGVEINLLAEQFSDLWEAHSIPV